MRKKVLVARRAPAAVIEKLSAQFDVDAVDGATVLTPAELRERLQGKDGVYITGTERITAELLDACPQLRAVCTMSVGYNHIDLAACTARRVLVTNTPDVLTETTADLGFALLMAAARRMSEGERMLRDGQWKSWAWDFLAGADVHGTTLGILGMGRIGQAIARRGRFGFGMRVVYHNRSRLPAQIETELAARFLSKDELLAVADHLVLVLPYSAESHHCMAAPELARMKPTATLVNIARGGIVDENALAAALREGRLAAAGLDVFEGEPQVNPALLTLPNVVLTPHIGSATMPTRLAMAGLAADNLVAALTGATPPTPLNPEVLPL
ncbi:D-glycerate dehydrogenase [Roseateles asaccharophilus]|uniref:Gluconate 2-dehydrogenase n=1 Tax=Roseateles asaccharophilus TaxID=582607 RepID=A0ABU2AFI9_9BURK|nr:D-glycerate dehydrogenase [Roseateles asaccharophilus]MDR7335970.1 gluconate 2-dehydrogenase [Roseateles asaccharophilus]